MKILFATSHFGFLRNFEPAIRLLAKRGHAIHLVADRGENLGGMRSVEGLVRDYPGQITYGRGSNPRKRTWHAFGSKVRLCLDYWRYFDAAYEQSSRLKARAALQAPRFAVRSVEFPVLRTRTGIRLLTRCFRVIERAVPDDPGIRRLLEQQAPDVVLITPLLYFGSTQVDYVRAARALGLPSVLCVGSWDHLTTKGRIHDTPDRITVWNEVQRQEALNLHGIAPERVAVTGAQAYDHWFTAQPSVAREEFCRRTALDPNRPILLYLCSSKFIAPYEVGFVEKWIRALRRHTGSALSDANILIRPHPQNFEQWRDIDLSAYGPVAVWPRAGANPVDHTARAEYFDSMHYSVAVVGVNTSALIEAGIVGRPVYTVLSEEFAATQEGTLHFRHLQNVRGGLVHVAQNLDEHLAQLEDALDRTSESNAKSLSFVQAFVRPHGLETPAAPVFADVIEETAQRRPVCQPEPFWVPLLRQVLYPLALLARQMATRSPRRQVPAFVAPRRSAKGLRIFFAMASPEYMRYYDSTVRLLAQRGHHVVIAVNHLREKKRARLDGLERDSAGIHVAGLIPERGGLWQRVGKGLRGVTDFVRFLHPRYARAPALRGRMKRKVLPLAFRFLDRIRTLSEPNLARMLAVLAALERAIPSSRRLERFISRYAPDVLLVSPLIDAASDQVDLVKTAQALALPTVACIASWDNLTNKGLMRVQVDGVLVWNEIQKTEAVDLHAVQAERVEVTGAQLFDRWFDRTPSQSREEFCAMVGLPVDRPFVLFTGSSGFISKAHAELSFVRTWIAALRASPDARVRALAVLVRPHPYNTAACEQADLSDLEAVGIWPRVRYNPVDEQERATYFDSIAYSSAVVGINTSAMVEAAIVGRPVLSILAREFAATQDGTLHFHYLRAEHGGCVRVASSLEEHTRQLALVLEQPELIRDETSQFVASFVRPRGLDKPCTPVAADAIERLARQGTTSRVETPVWAYPIRLGLLLVASFAGFVALLARSPRASASARKAIRTRFHRTRKAVAKLVRTIARKLTRTTRQFVHTAVRAWRREMRQLFRLSIVRPARLLVRLARRGWYRVAMLLKHETAADADPDR